MTKHPSLLITGGSGYLGRRLARSAQAHWDVTATFLSHQPSIPGCCWARLDIREADRVVRLFEQLSPQVVIHTAALRSGEELMHVNVDGTRHVALAAAQVGARMIHLSTDVLFDGKTGNYLETDPPSPITPYGRSKASAEMLLAELTPLATVVRISLIYGLDTPDHHMRWMLETLRQGQPVTLFADEFRCPIWVETLAAALLELATLDYTGVLHVAGGQVLNRYEFGIRMLCFHGIDSSGVMPVQAATLGLTRPLNCTLDTTRAKGLLKTPLLGVDEAIARYQETRQRSLSSCQKCWNAHVHYKIRSLAGDGRSTCTLSWAFRNTGHPSSLPTHCETWAYAWKPAWEEQESWAIWVKAARPLASGPTWTPCLYRKRTTCRTPRRGQV